MGLAARHFHPLAAPRIGLTPDSRRRGRRPASCCTLCCATVESVLRRTLPFAAALTLVLAAGLAPAQDTRLPDIGSSAGEVISPKEQSEYGAMTLAQLRHYDYVLEDPLIDGWLQSMGNRLAAASEQPKQPFTFFMLRDRQINAFATLGGYIGVNAGLVLTARSEDEVAGVLSHEIAHVTQAHVLRAVERAKKDSIPILLAMLGAIAVAQSSGGNSSDDATMAAVMSAQGLIAQRQIDYTRSNEAEADRIGIRTLSRSGYDPEGMASFFERMQAASRGNQGGDRDRAPDYLLTHPVTSLRITEARERAAKLPKPTVASADAGMISSNPLLPGSLRLPTAPTRGATGQFDWARERLRAFSANTPAAAIAEYERIGRGQSNGLNDAQRYGLAVARLLAGQGTGAASELTPLLVKHPGDLWITLALAEAEARSGNAAAADKRFEALVDSLPSNRAVALTYAKVLGERNTPASGKRAQAILRPLLARSSEDPLFQQTFARASEIAGDSVRAGEAYAEAAYLNGRPEQALIQLNTLKKRADLDYYARARIDARIAAITPTVLELRRQGVKDEVLNRRLDDHPEARRDRTREGFDASYR
ncbi:M48 family metallopeptidase [Luteimonas gilva]|uniref:Putative beta-barrel assembly-enhancing protease n=2 Tax=Luteimonas gilva TaxID=2572684 RepID=A0A4U5JSW5_9GAMM|nr:M48 family metallopeptidase [Luteimonas gilva]